MEGWLSGPSFIACPKPPGVVPDVANVPGLILHGQPALHPTFLLLNTRRASLAA